MCVANATAGRKRYAQCIILGIDGLDGRILEYLMRENKVPNFSRLAGEGAFVGLQTSNPAVSPVAWSDMATGCWPEEHGITDFLHRRLTDYQPYISLRKNVDGIFGTRYEPARQREGFWKLTSQAGIPTTVIRWPVTFPAEKVAGNFLSGLGTPDIQGSEGQYFYYTTETISKDDLSPGNIICVQWDGGTIKTSLAGPMISRQNHAELQMAIRRIKAGCIRIDLAGVPSFEARRGQWTQWIKIAFRAGITHIRGQVKFLLVESEPELKLFVYPVNIDPANQAMPITYPERFGRLLQEEIGSFHTLGMPELVHPLSHGRYGYDEFLSEIERIWQERAAMFTRGLEKLHKGLLAFVFDHTDRLQHALWATRDPRHPGYEEKQARTYGAVIGEHYQRMDGAVGQAMARTDEKTLLLVVSDHGFGSFRRQVHINRWLIEQGYLHLKNGNQAEGAGLFGNVDWDGTKAYAAGFASVYLNLTGRESGGIVRPGDEYDNLCRELAERLERLNDPEIGCPAVHKVYCKKAVTGADPMKYNGADLLVGCKAGYRFSWQTAVGAAPLKTIEDNVSKWSGDHIFDPSFVPGVLLCNKRIATTNPRCVDIAASVLDCFGLEKQAYMAGTSFLKD